VIKPALQAGPDNSKHSKDRCCGEIPQQHLLFQANDEIRQLIASSKSVIAFR
jgi:hypothetical protein